MYGYRAFDLEWKLALCAKVRNSGAVFWL